MRCSDSIWEGRVRGLLFRGPSKVLSGSTVLSPQRNGWKRFCEETRPIPAFLWTLLKGSERRGVCMPQIVTNSLQQVNERMGGKESDESKTGTV